MTETVRTPKLHPSSIKDFDVSPLRFWAQHVDPNRERPEATPFQRFGSALHHRVLRPNTYADHYCQKFDASLFDGALETVADIREWIRDTGNTPKGTRKADLIECAQAIDPDVLIADELKYKYEQDNSEKVWLPRDDFERVQACAESLLSEPHVQEILAHPVGVAEKRNVVHYRGVDISFQLDWATPDVTMEIKTFTAKRDRSIDASVTAAIWYERYHYQAYFYCLCLSIMRGYAPPNATKAPKFVFAFVESEEPFETRLREFAPKTFGEVNMLWEKARIAVHAGIDLWKEYYEEFGPERPWRHAQDIRTLTDEDFPGLIFGR